jgi:hypothetical protein
VKRCNVILALALAGCTFTVEPVTLPDATADFAPPRDLASPPDLAPPPDLTPIPVFDPDVQADVTAMNCASDACHATTNAQAPAPVLLAKVKVIADYQYNYSAALNFTAAGVASPWLTRPLGGNGHAVFFSSTSDPRYQRWALWIRGGAPF